MESSYTLADMIIALLNIGPMDKNRLATLLEVERYEVNNALNHLLDENKISIDDMGNAKRIYH